jgi:chromosome partitioning protein
MFITVAHYKGGCGKSTTAVHLAAFFSRFGSTLLIDGDPNRSASVWAKRGSMPFTVVDEAQGAYEARNYKNVVIDTQARPGQSDLEVLARGCDLLVIPSVPSTLDTDALVLTIGAVQRLAPERFRVLLTKVPPVPEQDAVHLRVELDQQGIPVFKAEIPRLKAFEKAAAEGVPVSMVQDARAQRAWEAYEATGKEICNGRK